MTTCTQSKSETRAYNCLADLKPAEQEGILFRLITRHASRVSARFNGSADAEDVAINEAYRTFSNLMAFRLNGPRTAEEIERFVVNRYYFFAPRRVNRLMAGNPTLPTFSLDQLMERAGDTVLPTSEYGVPSQEMSEADVYDMLDLLGVHEDWLTLFQWVAMRDFSWPEVAARVYARYGIRIDEPTLRQRWSRLRKDLGAGVAAGLAGMPLKAFRLEKDHWAALPMKAPKPRRR